MGEDRNLFDGDKERSRELLFRLIDDSGADSAEKELLKSLMGNLLEYQRGKFQSLLSRYEEAARRPDAPVIVTGLAKRNGAPDKRLSVLPAAPNGAFAVCDYEEFVERVSFFQDIERSERRYEGSVGGRKFFYRLRRDDSFLRYERRLRRLANHYGIRNFVIYAPLFRRYALLEAVERPDGAEWKNVNYRLKENGLQDKLMLCAEYDLFTNISEREKSPSVRETPGNPGDGQVLCFHFQTDGREYVDLREWPDSLPESGVEFVRGDREICIRVSGQSALFPYALAFRSYVFADCGEASDGLRFENRTGGPRPERIQSEADIEMALRALPAFPVEAFFPGKKPENLRLCQYENEWAYPGAFSSRSRYPVYVRFRNDASPFSFDRATFALSCLNAWYPECLWLGGYDD
ncbi:MAG: hypothetical protein IJQ81_18600 [Oscillibacter sp.]|nr:hypothetical protein [Oscillibacter sp.]